MRPDAAHGEERALEGLVLGAFLGVLLDHAADHLEMAELLDGDVLQHVADAASSTWNDWSNR